MDFAKRIACITCGCETGALLDLKASQAPEGRGNFDWIGSEEHHHMPSDSGLYLDSGHGETID